MWNWVKRNYKHFIILGLLTLYVFLANPVYSHFFVRTGKPESNSVRIPAVTMGVIYNLVELRPVVVNGESLYELKGFAFVASNPTQVNRITIILIKDKQNLAFSTSSVPFPDMIQSYPVYKPGMDRAEFSMLVSQQMLETGNYKIGVLLENENGSDRWYVQTGSSIKKTPNTINFNR